jgi:hypothetical protein
LPHQNASCAPPGATPCDLPQIPAAPRFPAYFPQLAQPLPYALPSDQRRFVAQAARLHAPSSIEQDNGVP